MESDSSLGLSHTSIGTLKELLKSESRSHEDTGHCYDTLQKEYDDLLRKYAQAENTIDQLRIDTLREKIEKCKVSNQDDTESFDRDGNVWKSLYDDLIYRTNKLQDAVTEFQAHLANHECTSDEVDDIFDSLRADFENIANVYQSMKALGIKTSKDDEHPKESLLVDDLERNLYRLGLRLEEIQDEIGDKLGGDGIHSDEKSNYSVSSSILRGADLKRSFDGESNKTETTKAENDICSDDDVNDVNLQLRDWEPATEDATQPIFYKKQFHEQYSGLDPVYLSRWRSAPAQLCNVEFSINTANAPYCFTRVPPKDNLELGNVQEHLDDKKSRKSPTYANLNKSSTLEKPVLIHSHPNVALISTEDSGFLEGSQANQQTFPSRNVTSPLITRDHKVEVHAAFESTRNLDQGHILEESTGERYRKRLDSLRGYILAKRAANNSLSAVENSEASLRKKTGDDNYHYSSQLFNAGSGFSKMNSGYEVNDPGSSTTESILSSVFKPAVEEKEKKMRSRKHTSEEKPGIQKQDIDMLREEMHGVRDIVLDLKDSVVSLSQPQDPMPTDRFYDSLQRHLVDNSSRDELDLSRESTNEPLAFPQVKQLQNKQIEMLEKLDNKLDDISKKLKPSVDQRQPLSRGSPCVNTGRLDSPSRCSHGSSYYYQVGEENITEINGMRNTGIPEIRKSPQLACAARNTGNIKGCKSCDNLVLPPNNCTLMHAGCCSQAYSHRVKDRVESMMLNQHCGSTPLNHHPKNYDQTCVHTASHQTDLNGDLNASIKFYREKFGEIGEQLNKLTSHLKECKENEEKQIQEKTFSQQMQHVKFLCEKLEKLSTRFEDEEKKIPSNTKTTSISPLPVPFSVCGHIGVHQHGNHIFNGHHIIEQSGISELGTRMMHPQGHTTTSPSNFDLRRNDHTYKTHSTPKNRKRSPSPIAYHHYLTAYPPQQQEDYGRQSSGRSTGCLDTDVKMILSNRVYSSLERASLAAIHMETLSKKMLCGITTDLFNSGL